MPPGRKLTALDDASVEEGLKQKAEEFRAAGDELYVKEPMGAE